MADAEEEEAAATTGTEVTAEMESFGTVTEAAASCAAAVCEAAMNARLHLLVSCLVGEGQRALHQ